MTDKYAYWRDSLAGKNPDGHIDHPECGFYRMKRGDRWVPVAVWALPGGGLNFKINGEVVGEQVGTDQWPWYSHHPVTEAEYRKVAEQGGAWSDSDPTVSAILNTVSKPAPAIKDVASITPQQIAESLNSGKGLSPEEQARLEMAFTQYDELRKPPPDPTDEYREQIKTAVDGVKAYDKIESDEASTRAAGLRNMLLKLRKDADDARTTAKQPHLKAAKKIDDTWQPLIKEAQAGADSLRKAMENWEDAKREAAKQAADRLAEAAREAAEKPGDAVQPIRAAPSNLPQPAGTQIKPTFGRAASVGTRLVVESIDPDKMLVALRDKPQWAAVVQFLNELAASMASNGIVVDGMTTREGAKIK